MKPLLESTKALLPAPTQDPNSIVSGASSRSRSKRRTSAAIGDHKASPQLVSPDPSDQQFRPERFYTVRDVADIYRVTPRCVRQWIDNKELRAWRRGRLIRIPQSALVEFDRAR